MNTGRDCSMRITFYIIKNAGFLRGDIHIQFQPDAIACAVLAVIHGTEGKPHPFPIHNQIFQKAQSLKFFQNGFVRIGFLPFFM